MGLAATQARFLAITSRKANCEFRSMELAQQKLSLSRELEAATDDYNYAIDASKLVWDAAGDGTARYNLTYDLMMNPSELNKYKPYLLSRQDGKLAFDEKWYNAASKVFNMDEETKTTDGGIKVTDDNGNVLVFYAGDKIVDANGNAITMRDADGNVYTDSAGNPLTYQDFDDVKTAAFANFIEGLKENKAISGSIANKMLQDDEQTGEKRYTFYADAGVGGELMGKETGNMMTLNSLLSYIDYIVTNTNTGYFAPDSKEAKLAESLVFDFDKKDYISNYEEEDNYDKEKYKNTPYYKLTKGAGNVDSSTYMQPSWSAKSGTTCLLYNGNYCNDVVFNDVYTENGDFITGVADYSTRAVSLADMLNEDITLMVTGKQNYQKVLDVITDAIANGDLFKSGSIIDEPVGVWYDWLVQADGGEHLKFEQLVAYAKYADGADDAPSRFKLLSDYGVDVNKNSPEVISASSSLALLTYLDTLAKGMYKLLMPKDATTVEQNAFYVAFTNVVNRMRNLEPAGAENFYVDCANGLFANANSEMNAKLAVQNADSYNCWVKYGNEWALSFSNLTNAFLSDFVDGMDAYQDGCHITQFRKNSTYIMEDVEYLYDVNVINEKDTGLWESEFYSVIFNNICASGCYQNDMIGDKTYLDNALKNAQMFVTAEGDNNYYYQQRYVQATGKLIADNDQAYQVITTGAGTPYIMEESDSAAVATAEREYIYKKNQINYKEDLIDIEMKKLDSEISELQTEYNSVMSMIAKNIEKTFKQFQS